MRVSLHFCASQRTPASTGTALGISTSAIASVNDIKDVSVNVGLENSASVSPRCERGKECVFS